MEFLNFNPSGDPSAINAKFEAYRNYIEANIDRWPSGAREFALCDWHYDPTDHRCPHDSWVISLTLSEERQAEDRYVSSGIVVEIVLLGAYHDGKLRLRYENVTSYNLGMIAPEGSVRTHGDWSIDELRLSEPGKVIHEIEFHSGAHWHLEFDDLTVIWEQAHKSELPVN